MPRVMNAPFNVIHIINKGNLIITCPKKVKKFLSFLVHQEMGREGLIQLNGCVIAI